MKKQAIVIESQGIDTKSNDVTTTSNDVINQYQQDVIDKVKQEFPTFDPTFQELHQNDIDKLNDNEFAQYLIDVEQNVQAKLLLNKILNKKRKNPTTLTKVQYMLLMILNSGKSGINVEGLYRKGKLYKDANLKPSTIKVGTITTNFNVQNKTFDQRAIVELQQQGINVTIQATTFPSRPDSLFATDAKCNFENHLKVIRGHQNLIDYLLKEGATSEMITFKF
jgi:hypothetical protein